MTRIKAASGLACAVCLLAGMARAQSRPTVPITLTVDTTSRSYAVPPDFSGLSFGTTSLRGGKNGYFFDSSSSQVLTLFQTLGIKNLRIGGTSVDTNTGNYIPSNQDIDALFRFAPAAGVKVIYSLRLMNGDPSQDAATAQYVWQNYQPLLANFAIGNEPNIYHNADPKITNYSSYLTDWKMFAGTITNAVPDAKFGGPDSDNGGNSWGTNFARDEMGSGIVTSIYFHNYVGASSNGKTIQQLIDAMLSSSWVTNSYPTQYNGSGAPVLARGLPYRFTEANNYYTGGGAGVNGGNNCFATALFALDYMHWWAEHNASGLNFHTSMWKYNGTFYPDTDGNYQIYPIGYGIKAFDVGGHGYVEPVTISNPNNANVTAYAEGNAQDAYVTVINKTHSPYLNSVDAVVTIQPNGFTAASAASMLLTGDAPGNGASMTASLGGASIPDNSRWLGRWVPLSPDTNGSVTVTVPSATAAVVRIRAASNYVGPIQINQNGALEVFGTRSNGEDQHQRQNNDNLAGRRLHGGETWHNWEVAADVPNSPLNSWNGWADLGGGVLSTGGTAVVKNLNNTLEVFVPGSTGDVYDNYQLAPGGAWSGWTDMGSDSNGITDLQAANNADGSLSVFGIGSNGDIWYASQSAPGVGWSNWLDMGGVQIQAGFVVRQNLDGHLEIVGVDRSGSVWQNGQTDLGAWSDWTELYGQRLDPRLAIARNLDGRLEVFGVDRDGHLWHNSQTSPGSAWNSWSAIPGKQLEPGFVAGQDRNGYLVIFGVSTHRRNAPDKWSFFDQNRGGQGVWSIAQQIPGGSYGDWTDLGGSNIDPKLVVGNTADGRIQLFGTGSNQDVWSDWQQDNGDGWSGWNDFGGRGIKFYPGQH